jgi:hypothetical protein
MLDDRCFCHPHGNFAFVPSMTTSASTKRYMGCKNERSIIARISDKTTRTKTTINQGFLMTDLLQVNDRRPGCSDSLVAAGGLHDRVGTLTVTL